MIWASVCCDRQLQTRSMIETEWSCLNYLEELQQFTPHDIEGNEVVLEREHIVEVLFKDVTGEPLRSEPSRINDYELGRGNCFHHKIGDKVGQFWLIVQVWFEIHFRFR